MILPFTSDESLPSRLYRRLSLILTAFVSLCLFLTGARQAQATHVLGGEITYVYLGNNGPVNAPFRFRITMTGYVDGTRTAGLPQSSFPNGNYGNSPRIGIYDATTNTLLQTQNIPDQGIQNNPNITRVVIPVPPGCTADDTIQALSFFKNQHTFEVSLPFSITGYHVAFSSFARSRIVRNLANPNGTGNTIYGFIPSPIYANNSPQFVSEATTFFCTGDTATFASNAVDPDGDRLVYTLASAWDQTSGGNPPAVYNQPPNVLYASGYSAQAPFGSFGFASINPATGLTTYNSRQTGAFVVAYQIQEFRTLANGQEILLSTTRREMQIVVRDCLPNNPPQGNAGAPGSQAPSEITITEGESATFTVGATDPDSIIIRPMGDILTGTGGYTGPLATMPLVRGIGQVSTTFNWTTACGIRGTFPVNIALEDKGCPPKTSNIIVNINVLPFRAPQQIAGPDTVCPAGGAQEFTYQVASTAPDSEFRWAIEGGQIVSTGTGKTVRVRWSPIAGPGLAAGVIRIIRTSAIGGCRDSVNRIIRLAPQPSLAVASSDTLCGGDTLTVTATGATGYTWRSLGGTPTEGLIDQSGPTVRVNPIRPMRFEVTGRSPEGCLSRDTILAAVIEKLPLAGPDTALCSGTTIQIGRDTVSGYQVSWTPATGLDNAGAPRPNLTLTNTTQQDQIRTYVALSTDPRGRCQRADTVQVRIKPLPSANAGPDLTACAGTPVVLGPTTPLPGLPGINYTWTADTLLMGIDTVPNPGVILPGITLGRILNVRLTTLNRDPRNRCRNTDSLLLTVNPQPVLPLTTDSVRICSGDTAQLMGGTPEMGLAYQWSGAPGTILSPTTPSTGLTGRVPDGVGQDTGRVRLRVLITATGCRDSVSVPVSIQARPAVALGNDTALCSGQSLTLSVPLIGVLGYNWTGAGAFATGGTTSSTLSILPRLTPPAGRADSTLILSLGLRNTATGCTNNDQIAVTVYALPVVLAAATDTVRVCSGAPLELGAAPLPGVAYLWTSAGGPSRIPAGQEGLARITLVDSTPNRLAPAFTRLRLLGTQAAPRNCQNRDSVVVMLLPRPQYALVRVDSLCVGDTAALGGPAVPGNRYAWSPAALLEGETTANPLLINRVTGPNAQDVALRVLVSGPNGCADSVAWTVRLQPPVLFAGAVRGDSVCAGSPFNLTLSPQPGQGYDWLPGPFLPTGATGTSATGTTVRTIGGTDTTLTYAIRITQLSTGCRTIQERAPLRIYSNPLAITGADTSLCVRDSIRLGAPALPGITYQWTPSGPTLQLRGATTAQPTLLVSGSGANQIYLVTTRQDVGCQTRDSVRVTPLALPLVPMGPANPAICLGDTLDLGAGPALGTLVFTWQGPGLINNLGPQVQAIPGAPGQYRYSLTVLDLTTGCRNSDSLTARVNALPLVSAGPDTSFCSGAQVTVGQAPVLGQMYTWTSTTPLGTPTVANPVFTRINGSQGVVRDTLQVLTTETATGCSAADEVIVTTLPRPLAPLLASSPLVVCPGTEGQPYQIEGALPGAIYTWSVASGGTIVSGQGTDEIRVNYGLTPGDVEIRIQVTNSFGCLSDTAASLRVTVNPILRPALPSPLSGRRELCFYDAVDQYRTVTSPNSSYTWRLVQPGRLDSTVTGAGAQVGLRWPATGEALIWVEEIAAPPPPAGQCFGRSDTLRVTILESPDSTLTISGPRQLCSGVPLRFGLPGLPGSTFAWTLSGASGSILTQTGPSDTLAGAGLEDGIYQLTVTETSVAGCPGRPLNLSLQVDPTPQPAFAQDGYVLCPSTIDQRFGLTNTAGAGSTFAWQVVGGVAASGAGTSTLDVRFDPAAPVWTVMVSEVSAAGCPSTMLTAPITADRTALMIERVTTLEESDEQIRLEYALANAENLPPTIDGRPNQVLIEMAPGATGGTFGEVGRLAPTGEFEHRPDVSPREGTLRYRVSIVNACGARVTSDEHRTVHLTGQADEQAQTSRLTWTPYEPWTGAQTIARQTVLRNTDGADGGRLTPYEPLTGLAAGVLSAEPRNAGDGFKQCYRVEVVDNEGRRSLSNIACIDFANPLQFPNVVTPYTVDGLNDQLTANNLRFYPRNRMTITNRWGRVVHRFTDFDGRYTPSDLEPGTYYYEFSSGSLKTRGWFEVVR